MEYETLSKALVDAANEVGWTPSVEDKSDREYDLQPVRKTEKYKYTTVKLKKDKFDSIFVMLDKEEPTNSFTIIDETSSIPEEEIKKYLHAVSRNLGLSPA